MEQEQDLDFGNGWYMGVPEEHGYEASSEDEVLGE